MNRIKNTTNPKEVVLTVFKYLFICALAVTTVTPFLWMLSSSFKFDREVFQVPMYWIPKVFRWENYVEIFKQITFGRFYFNTLKIASLVTLLQLTTSSMAAFAFTKLKFPGRKGIFSLYLCTLMVPAQVILIPQFIIIKNLGLFNNHLSLILLAAFSPFGVFMLTQFFRGIPSTLLEAAKIDGANVFMMYYKIVVPLAMPAMSALAIMTFIGQMNDFMNPMIYINDVHLRTITLGIRMFATENTAQTSLQMAATVCALFPVIVVYVFAQEQIIRGIAFNGGAGVKG